MNQTTLAKLVQYIESADLALQQAREILAEAGGDQVNYKMARSRARDLKIYNDSTVGLKIIEGIFNGQNMVGPDGKEYSVPANYASKSKLVEGDTMKLTIQPDGSFLYKQINVVEREHLKGELLMDEVSGIYSVQTIDGRRFNVLNASITYYKGQTGDQVTVIIPKDRAAQWAAVENIISKDEIHEHLPAVNQLLNNEEKKPSEYLTVNQSDINNSENLVEDNLIKDNREKVGQPVVDIFEEHKDKDEDEDEDEETIQPISGITQNASHEEILPNDENNDDENNIEDWQKL